MLDLSGRKFPNLNARFYPDLEQPTSPWKFQDYQINQYYGTFRTQEECFPPVAHTYKC